MAELLLELLETEPEGSLGAGAEIGFQVVDVGANRLHRFAGRVREVGQQVEVVHAENARGRSASMNVLTPRQVSRPTLM